MRQYVIDSWGQQDILQTLSKKIVHSFEERRNALTNLHMKSSPYTYLTGF